MNLSITPIFQVRERSAREGRLEVQDPTNSKVRGLVLEKIGQTKGALLPSASAPQVVTFLLPGFESGKMDSMQKKRKAKLRKTPLPRKAPIGLMPVDPEGWVNALMQFLLYVPGFAESFSIAPRCLFPIQEFIDQYHNDLAEGKSVSSANGSVLFRLFTLQFPNFFFREIIEALMHLLIPKWRIFHSIYEALSYPRSPDLFLSTSLVIKQVYADPGQYYDLDTFIEKRPDGARVHFITYVKIDGCWYQCDGERITHLRSDLLALPLQRGVLSHYRQVQLRG